MVIANIIINPLGQIGSKKPRDEPEVVQLREVSTLMNLRRLLLSGLTLLAVTGCAEFQEEKIEARNHYLAKVAWENLEVVYEHMDFTDDFGRGFREGYYDVCNGGNGCPPVIPPRRYWSVKYASPRGHQQTHAWFEGYRYGAVVAEQDGVGIWVSLPTSRPAAVSPEQFRPEEGPTPGVAEEGLELQETPPPSEEEGDQSPPGMEVETPSAPPEGTPMPEMPQAPREEVPPMPEVPSEVPAEKPTVKPEMPAEPDTESPFQLKPRTPDDEQSK